MTRTTLRLLFRKISQPGFVSSSILYIITSVLSAGLGFLTLLLLTKFLTAEDMGKIETFVTVGMLLQVFLLWGNESILINYYSKYGNKKEYANTFYGIFRHATIALVLIILMSYIFKELEFGFLFAIFIWAFLNSIKQLIRVYYQLERKVLSFMIIELMVSFFTLIICLLIIRSYQSFYVRLIASVLAIICVLIFAFRKFYYEKIHDIKLCRSELSIYYKKGTPLALSDLASWGVEKADRLQVVASLGLANLGVYSIATQFSSGAGMIGSAISRAWQPYLVRSAEYNRNDILKNILKIGISMTICIMVISICIYFFILLVMDETYSQSAILAIPLCAGYAFDGIWKLYNNIMIYENKFNTISILIVVLTLVKLTLNFILLPIMGLYGVVTTAVITYMLGMIISSLYVHFVMKWFKSEPYNLKN